jgi:hypothetical protein
MKLTICFPGIGFVHVLYTEKHCEFHFIVQRKQPRIQPRRVVERAWVRGCLAFSLVEEVLP